MGSNYRNEAQYRKTFEEWDEEGWWCDCSFPYRVLDGLIKTVEVRHVHCCRQEEWNQAKKTFPKLKTRKPLGNIQMLVQFIYSLSIG